MTPSDGSRVRDGHLDEGEIHAWLDGALPAADAAAVEAHIATCAVCREVVAEARGLIAASSRILSALDTIPADVLPTSVRSRRRSPFRALAGWPLRAIAAVLLVAVGATVVLQREPQRASESDRVGASRLDSGRAASAPSAAVVPSSPSASTSQPALSAPIPPVSKAARAKSHPVPTAPAAPPTSTEGDRRVRESLRDQAVNAMVAGAAVSRAATVGARTGGIGGTAQGGRVTPSVVPRLDQTITTSVAEAPAAPKLQTACDTLAHSRHVDSLKALRILHDTATPATTGAFGLVVAQTDSASSHDSLARVRANANRCP